MKRITLRELEIGLVRAAEREPERVGMMGRLFALDCVTPGCINGSVLCGAGWDWQGILNAYARGDIVNWIQILVPAAHPLANAAADLNDAGVPWGRLVRELGLVPGEAPLEIPGASEAVCK